MLPLADAVSGCLYPRSHTHPHTRFRGDRQSKSVASQATLSAAQSRQQRLTCTPKYNLHWLQDKGAYPCMHTARAARFATAMQATCCTYEHQSETTACVSQHNVTTSGEVQHTQCAARSRYRPQLTPLLQMLLLLCSTSFLCAVFDCCCPQTQPLRLSHCIS